MKTVNQSLMSMPIRGFMYDTGRGLNTSYEYMAEYVRRLSEYGYNMLMFNIEERFKFPSHPDLAEPESMTPEDAKKLSKLGKEYGVEIVPFMNCAGHCSGIGKTQRYSHLCCNEATEQLRIDLPEARALMLDLYNDIFDCFDSVYFHIGGDEIRHLDLIWPELDKPERWKKAMEYLNGMFDVVRSKGKIPMIWGDMLLLNPECLADFPKDVIVCDWSYFSAPMLKPLSNKPTLTKLRDAGIRTLYADSVNTFQGNPVVSQNSTMNITAGTREYIELFGDKAEGVLLTSWFTQGMPLNGIWPWIYLQGKMFKGEWQGDMYDMTFLDEYTRIEWGLDDSSLREWYEIAETGIQKELLNEAFLDASFYKLLTDKFGSRGYKLLHNFIYDFLTVDSGNKLKILSDARKNWFTRKRRELLLDHLNKGLAIAEDMVKKAKFRKEEPIMLRDFNKLMISIIEMTGIEEELCESYKAAADVQISDPVQYNELCDKIEGCFEKLCDMLAAIADWEVDMTAKEDQTNEVPILLRLAHKDLLERSEAFKKDRKSGHGFVLYDIYMNRAPGRTMMRYNKHA